mgnify:CR=1 FL=1
MTCELQIYCSIKSPTSTKIKNITILNSNSHYKNNPKNPEKLLDLSMNRNTQFTLRPDQKIFYDFNLMYNVHIVELHCTAEEQLRVQ